MVSDFLRGGANLNVLYQHRTCPPNHCLICVDAFLNNRKHVNVSRFPTLDDQSLQNRHVMVQYWFDGPPVEVKSKPHGNSRTSQPFFRTAESAKKRHQEIAATKKPKDVMQLATQECGGELEAKGMQCLPRNIQQIKNYRRTGHSKDSNVLYSVML